MTVIWSTALAMTMGVLLLTGAGYSAVAGWWRAERDVQTERLLNDVLHNDVARLNSTSDEQRRLLRATRGAFERSLAACTTR